MPFSYLYILQRQWIRDVNNFYNSAKTSGPHDTVCFITSQSGFVCSSNTAVQAVTDLCETFLSCFNH